MDTQVNVIVEPEQPEVVNSSWAGKVLAIGAALGAVTGLTAAYLLVQRTKKIGEMPEIELGEGIKLGVLIFSLLRSVALIADRDEK